MFDACPVHPKGTMVIPMLWIISGYVVCMLGVKNQKLHIPPYPDPAARPRHIARGRAPPGGLSLATTLNTQYTHSAPHQAPAVATLNQD